MRRYRSVRSHRRGVRHLDARARPEDGGKRRDCDHESKRDVSAHGEPPSVASTESAGGTSRLRSYRDLRESCVKRITDLLKLGKPEVACRVHPWTLEQAERVLNTGSTLRFTPSRRGRACPGLDPGSTAVAKRGGRVGVNRWSSLLQLDPHPARFRSPTSPFQGEVSEFVDPLVHSYHPSIWSHAIALRDIALRPQNPA